MTGFHARTPDELGQVLLRLVDDPALRAEVGARARRVVEERHSMAVRSAPRWQEALA